MPKENQGHPPPRNPRTFLGFRHWHQVALEVGKGARLKKGEGWATVCIQSTWASRSLATRHNLATSSENQCHSFTRRVKKKYEGVVPGANLCKSPGLTPTLVQWFCRSKHGGLVQGRKKGKRERAHPAAPVLLYQESKCLPRNHPSPAKLCS